MDLDDVKATLRLRLGGGIEFWSLGESLLHVEWGDLYGVIREESGLFRFYIDDTARGQVSGVQDGLVIARDVSAADVANPGEHLAASMIEYHTKKCQQGKEGERHQ